MARRKRSRSKGGFRRRARSFGGRVRRGASRARAFAKRHRGRSLGLVGKTGVGILAGAPLIGSALEAGDKAMGLMRSQQVGLMGTAKIAFWSFLNNLSAGFGSGELIGSVTVMKTDGSTISPVVAPTIPSGAWYKTSFIGGTLVAFDIAISWASRKLARVNSGVRFLGTKMTGGK